MRALSSAALSLVFLAQHIWALVILGISGAAYVAYSQDSRPRVYVSDSNSWSAVGGFTASRGSASGFYKAGARPQTVEIIKTFGERCPTVVVTMNKENADFIVLFDREGGKGAVARRDKIAVFKKDGDILFSDSTRSVGNAVKDSCQAIQAQMPTVPKVFSEPIKPTLAEAPKQDPPSQQEGANRIWRSGALLGAAATKQLTADMPTVGDGVVLVIKADRHIYLILADKDDIAGEGPEILFCIEGDKVFLLGDRQHQTRLLKTINT